MKPCSTKVAVVLNVFVIVLALAFVFGPFVYTAQRFFIEYLKRRFGADRFQAFTIQYLDDPDNYRRLFAQVFQVPFSHAIKEFLEAQVS
jgi:hypothetical protein